MSLPQYDTWSATVHGLHKGAELLSAVQRLTQPPLPAYQELGLQVQPEGFSSGRLPGGSRLVVDLISGSLVLATSTGNKSIYRLNGRSQSQVFSELFEDLAKNDLSQLLPPGPDLFERVSQGIAARGNRYHPPQRENLLDDSMIRVDIQASRNYLGLVQQVYTGLARFLAHSAGMRTPILVWPHGFDLSSLFFIGNEIDESQPHLNFGFAPYASGMDYAYLYAYAYPYPQRFEPPPLPKGARWNTQGWTGMLIPYSEMAEEPDLAGFIENSFSIINKGLHSLILNN